MALLKALFLACLLALVIAQDPCETNSYAPTATNRIAALTPATFTTLATSSAINSALAQLINIAFTTTSPFILAVYVATTASDHYMVKNCWNQQPGNPFCTSDGPQWLAYVRNTAVLGDDYRHVWAISADGSVDVSTAQLGREPNPYDPTVRPWFNATSGWAGWSSLITYASGGQGKTYSKAFGTGLVAAADRLYSEYCGACLSNSQAVSYTQGLLVTDLSSVASVTSVNDLSAIAKKMIDVGSVIGGKNKVDAFVAYNNAHYMVKFCTELGGGTAVQECSGQGYLFYAANPALFSDWNRRIYSLSADGTVGTMIKEVGFYNVTSRPFWLVANGWTDPYVFASSNVVGRSYVLAFHNGRVGADYAVAEPCARVSASGTTSSAPQIVASLAFLVISVVLLF